MRMTVEIDDKLLLDLQRVTGRQDYPALLHEGLRTLLALERVKRELRTTGGAPARRDRD